MRRVWHIVLELDKALNKMTMPSGGRRAPGHASASDARRGAIAWRSAASLASRRDGIPTPVDYFRHRPPVQLSPQRPADPHLLHITN